MWQRLDNAGSGEYRAIRKSQSSIVNSYYSNVRLGFNLNRKSISLRIST
jgi:hypothetical protein